MNETIIELLNQIIDEKQGKSDTVVNVRDLKLYETFKESVSNSKMTSNLKSYLLKICPFNQCAGEDYSIQSLKNAVKELEFESIKYKYILDGTFTRSELINIINSTFEKDKPTINGLLEVTTEMYDYEVISKEIKIETEDHYKLIQNLLFIDKEIIKEINKYNYKDFEGTYENEDDFEVLKYIYKHLD